MSSNITFGIMIIAIGIYAIALNKYPGKQISHENAKKKFPQIEERKISLFDGIFCVIFGLLYMREGIILLAILFLAYYPTRLIFLKLMSKTSSK